MRDAIRRILRTRPRPEEVSAGEKPESIIQITAGQYMELAEQAGFTDVQRHEMDVYLDQEVWEAICDYGPYSQGALHYKYTTEVACNAMREAVRHIFNDPDWREKYPGMEERDGRLCIPRRWLWITARKP